MRKRSFFRSLRRDDEAASLAEYALLLGVVSVALLLVLTQFSGSVSNLFARSTNTMTQASADGTSGSGGTGGAGNSGSNGNSGGNGNGNSGGNGNGNSGGNGNGNNK